MELHIEIILSGDVRGVLVSNTFGNHLAARTGQGASVRIKPTTPIHFMACFPCASADSLSSLPGFAVSYHDKCTGPELLTALRVFRATENPWPVQHLKGRNQDADSRDKFNQGGIEILSPSFAAIGDGNHITVPEANLGPDYVADGFRIRTMDGSGLP